MAKVSTISLLDCTLRDGGCVNDFAFGIETMRKLLRAVEKTGVQYVELGYLDKKNGALMRRTMYADVASIYRNRLFEQKKTGITYLAMIDYGKYPDEELPERRADGLDGIRLCFHKKDRAEAVRMGKRIREKGYRLMLQAMVCTRYTDGEFEELLRLASAEIPDLDAFYIVDSFGCMSQEYVRERLKLADRILPEGTALGLHTHNNQDLSMKHAQNAIALSLQRELIIDGTLYGMGKGAGNLKTESIAEYLNQERGTSYETGAAGEAVKTIILPLYRIYDWGYCPEYLLSSKYHLTPSYAKHFYRVRGLSLEQTEELLSGMPEAERDSFNKAAADRLLEEAGLGLSAPPEETLLDARGYEILLESSSSDTVRICYMGAVETEHPGLKFDHDPYVTSHIREQEFQGSFCTVLKDTGLRKSGLKLVLLTEQADSIRIRAAGEALGIISTKAGVKTEAVFDVTGLCLEERAYLDKLHRILYLLLEEVDRICRKHDIHYYLIQGGLLGAFRHGEIIPWDDDLDLAMTRSDFERFRRLAPDELGESFLYLDCTEIGGFLDFMCRVMYMDETVPGNIFRKVEGKCRPELPNHQPLDIFILDRIPDDPKKASKQMTLIRLAYGLGMGHRAYVDMKEYSGRDWKTRAAVRILSFCGRCLPLKLIFRLHDWISTMYENEETEAYFMSNAFLPFIHTRYDRDWFTGGRTMRLGNREVTVPDDPEASLKRTYYDYYHYPPVDKRIPEHGPNASGVH